MMIDKDFYKLLSLPEKCLKCPDRREAVKDTCTFPCEEEPIELTEVVEEGA